MYNVKSIKEPRVLPKLKKNVTERMLFPNTDAAKEDVDDEAGKAEPRPSQDQL